MNKVLGVDEAIKVCLSSKSRERERERERESLPAKQQVNSPGLLYQCFRQILLNNQELEKSNHLLPLKAWKKNLVWEKAR